MRNLSDALFDGVPGSLWRAPKIRNNRLMHPLPVLSGVPDHLTNRQIKRTSRLADPAAFASFRAHVEFPNFLHPDPLLQSESRTGPFHPHDGGDVHLSRTGKTILALAAMMLTAASGAEVPKATTVRPMISGLMPTSRANRAEPRTSHSAPATRKTRPKINIMD